MGAAGSALEFSARKSKGGFRDVTGVVNAPCRIRPETVACMLTGRWSSTCSCLFQYIGQRPAFGC